MSKQIKGRYTRKLTPDPSGGFVATIHEFPGCIAHGASADEAMKNLEKVADDWMRAAEETKYPIPEPVSYEGSSGKIALRISRRLHKLAAERAELESVSLNQLIANALGMYLGRQEVAEATLAAVKSEIENAVKSLVQQRQPTFVLASSFGTPHALVETELRRNKEGVSALTGPRLGRQKLLKGGHLGSVVIDFSPDMRTSRPADVRAH